MSPFVDRLVQIKPSELRRCEEAADKNPFRHTGYFARL